jgi:hypothetical protein
MRAGRRMQSGARLVLAGMVAGLALPGEAGAATWQIDYGMTLLGLPLGTADITADIGRDRYTLTAKGRLTGLASMVSGGKGGASVTGAIVGGRFVPAEFKALGGTSALTRTFRIGFAGGAARQVEIAPPYEEKADKVPVLEAHKAGVLDPLTAMVGIAKGKAGALDPANCDRTLPIFEGSQRFDVVLAYAERRAVAIDGYSGDVLVCSARYVPISGHRAMRPTVKFMRDNREISVWLAPVAGGAVLAPLRISVLTTVGTAVFQARNWPGR